MDAAIGVSYEEWVAEVIRLATAGGAGGVDYSADEVSEVLGGGWQSVYESGEETAEAASAMRALLDDLRRDKARLERRQAAGDSWPTYEEWVEQLRMIVTSAEDEGGRYTGAEFDGVLGEGWQNVYGRAETPEEAAEAVMGFIRAGRRAAEPRQRGRELSAAWACRQLGITPRCLRRLTADTMLLWAHAGTRTKGMPPGAYAGVMEAEIKLDGDGSYSYGATDTLTEGDHAFTFGNFMLEGTKVVLLLERGATSGDGTKAFALLARVIRQINEDPLVSGGNSVSALWCVQPGLAAAGGGVVA